MRAILITAILLALSLPAFAQIQGSFSNPTYIREATSGDTLFADETVSAFLNGYSAMTIFYRLTDVVVAGTTLYFEAAVTAVRGGAPVGYAIVDSLVITSTSNSTPPSGSRFRVWNPTAKAVGVETRYRVRKSAAADSLVMIFRGYSEIAR